MKLIRNFQEGSILFKYGDHLYFESNKKIFIDFINFKDTIEFGSKSGYKSDLFHFNNGVLYKLTDNEFIKEVDWVDSTYITKEDEDVYQADLDNSAEKKNYFFQ